MAKNNGAMQSTYPTILVALCLKTIDTRSQCLIPVLESQSSTQFDEFPALKLIINLLVESPNCAGLNHAGSELNDD